MDEEIERLIVTVRADTRGFAACFAAKAGISKPTRNFAFMAVMPTNGSIP